MHQSLHFEWNSPTTVGQIAVKMLCRNSWCPENESQGFALIFLLVVDIFQTDCCEHLAHRLVLLRTNCSNFGDHLTFHLASSRSVTFPHQPQL